MQCQGQAGQDLFRKAGDLGHDAVSCRPGEAHPQDAGGAPAHLVDIGLKCGDVIDDLPSAVQQELACRCEVHPAGGAVEQLDAQLIFQLADLLREGRLGHMQALGRAAEVPFFRHRNEVVQLADVHGGARPSAMPAPLPG